jgi:hypothetical protein
MLDRKNERKFEELIKMFNQLMSNRPISIFVMLSTAAGAVVTIAGGYYLTYLLITTLSNS